MNTHSSSPSNSANTGWQVLGELKLPVEVNIEDTLNVWLLKILHPLKLHAQVLSQVLTSAQESAARLMQSPIALGFRHLHFLVFAPEDFAAGGQTWGFFQIERTGTATDGGNPRDHSIAYYLYREG